MFEFFNIITVQIWSAKCDFNKGYFNKFDDSNFDIDSVSKFDIDTAFYFMGNCCS